jgi:hypothetical protein
VYGHTDGEKDTCFISHVHENLGLVSRLKRIQGKKKPEKSNKNSGISVW